MGYHVRSVGVPVENEPATRHVDPRRGVVQEERNESLPTRWFLFEMAILHRFRTDDRILPKTRTFVVLALIMIPSREPVARKDHGINLLWDYCFHLGR